MPEETHHHFEHNHMEKQTVLVTWRPNRSESAATVGSWRPEVLPKLSH